MELSFPEQPPRDQGQLFRCVLQDNSKNFWALRNDFHHRSPAPISQEQRLTIVGLEQKLIYSTALYIQILEKIRDRKKDIFLYANFQYLMTDLYAILDAYAFLLNQLASPVSKKGRTFKGAAISFSTADFASAVTQAPINFIVNKSLLDLMRMMKILRNAYVHRDCPSYCITEGGSDIVYQLLLTGDDRKSFLDKRNDKVRTFDIADNGAVTQVHLGALSTYFYLETISESEFLADVLFKKYGDAKNKNGDAGLGSILCEPVVSVFNSLKKLIGNPTFRGS